MFRKSIYAISFAILIIFILSAEKLSTDEAALAIIISSVLIVSSYEDNANKK